jgi:hypothetical protein
LNQSPRFRFSSVKQSTDAVIYLPEQHKSMPWVMPANDFESTYLFRGDSGLRDGPIGRALGEDADSADIQNCADHVLRKESRRSSRYSSFTAEVAIARKFTSSADNRDVGKVKLNVLRQLESVGAARILDPDCLYNELLALGGKQTRQAADVRAAMRRNKVKVGFQSVLLSTLSRNTNVHAN